MEEFFYNGIWRMDWGLGNPNKTATLIAELMIAVWTLAYVKKQGFWPALGCFVVLGGCLIHTFSRGGLLAILAGLPVLIVCSPKPWRRTKLVAIGISGLLLFAYAFHLNAHQRYVQGMIEEDHSIRNRLELWRASPAMMVDAPQGWGIGNSGKAFMQWYQPTQRTEQYRTLVNSHLTWLVEVGWLLRFAYIFAWGSVFLLCLPTTTPRWQAIPLAVWLVFGVAAFFSSVAESIWLWIVPALTLAAALVARSRSMQWPRPSAWAVPPAMAVFVCAAFLWIGRGGPEIHGSRNQVIIGKRVPQVWMIVDERTLGGPGFSKSLRKHLIEHPADQGLGIVWSFASLPKELSGKRVVVVGSPEGLQPEKMRRLASSTSGLILLSPGYYPQETGIAFGDRSPVTVLFGEFSQSSRLVTWEETGKVRRIAGAADYFPEWPQIVLAKHEGGGS